MAIRNLERGDRSRYSYTHLAEGYMGSHFWDVYLDVTFTQMQLIRMWGLVTWLLIQAPPASHVEEMTD